MPINTCLSTEAWILEETVGNFPLRGRQEGIIRVLHPPFIHVQTSVSTTNLLRYVDTRIPTYTKCRRTVHTNFHTYVHTHTYTYIHMYTHIYIHTYITRILNHNKYAAGGD